MEFGLKEETRKVIEKLADSFTNLGKSLVKEMKILNKNLEDINRNLDGKQKGVKR